MKSVLCSNSLINAHLPVATKATSDRSSSTHVAMSNMIADKLLKALDIILEDMTFSTGAKAANVARVAANSLRRWCSMDASTDSVNCQLAHQFTIAMLQDLQLALRPVLHREVIRKRFYSIRSSTDFISQWTSFLQQTKVDSTTALYQQLTDIIFKDLMKSRYVIQCTQGIPIKSI